MYGQTIYTVNININVYKVWMFKVLAIYCPMVFRYKKQVRRL